MPEHPSVSSVSSLMCGRTLVHVFPVCDEDRKCPGAPLKKKKQQEQQEQHEQQQVVEEEGGEEFGELLVRDLKRRRLAF